MYLLHVTTTIIMRMQLFQGKRRAYNLMCFLQAETFS